MPMARRLTESINVSADYVAGKSRMHNQLMDYLAGEQATDTQHIPNGNESELDRQTTIGLDDGGISSRMRKCGIEDQNDTQESTAAKPSSPRNRDDHISEWTLVADKVWRYEQEQVGRLQNDINALLIFAGLFAAVVTAFAVQYYTMIASIAPNFNSQFLERNNQLLERIIMQINNSSALVDLAVQTSLATPSSALQPSTPTPPGWIATLWSVSLVLVLASASVAIAVNQWLDYHVRLSGANGPREKLRLWHLRHTAYHKWKVGAVVNATLVLLQGALLLFLAGLVGYLWPLGVGIAVPTLVFVALLGVFQLGTAAVSAFTDYSPYKSAQAQGLRWTSALLTLPVLILGERLCGWAYDHGIICIRPVYFWVDPMLRRAMEVFRRPTWTTQEQHLFHPESEVADVTLVSDVISIIVDGQNGIESFLNDITMAHLLIDTTRNALEADVDTKQVHHLSRVFKHMLWSVPRSERKNLAVYILTCGVLQVDKNHLPDDILLLTCWFVSDSYNRDDWDIDDDVSRHWQLATSTAQACQCLRSHRNIPVDLSMTLTSMTLQLLMKRIIYRRAGTPSSIWSEDRLPPDIVVPALEALNDRLNSTSWKEMNHLPMSWFLYRLYFQFTELARDGAVSVQILAVLRQTLRRLLWLLGPRLYRDGGSGDSDQDGLQHILELVNARLPDDFDQDYPLACRGERHPDFDQDDHRGLTVPPPNDVPPLPPMMSSMTEARSVVYRILGRSRDSPLPESAEEDVEKQGTSEKDLSLDDLTAA